MTVKLILDHTALAAFCAGSVDVGETIREVVDEGGYLTTSWLCLAQAAADVEPDRLNLLHLLTAHPHFVDPKHDPGQSHDWDVLGALARVYGSLPAACAAGLARFWDESYLLTARPDDYPGLPVIAVG